MTALEEQEQSLLKARGSGVFLHGVKAGMVGGGIKMWMLTLARVLELVVMS